MNIYVGNLNYRVKEDDLQKVMEDYGTVSLLNLSWTAQPDVSEALHS